MIDIGIAELTPIVGVRAACAAFGRSRASHYRHQSRNRCATDAAADGKPVRRARRQPRALAPEERQAVLAELHSERFVDSAPGEVVATLLDEGRYLCSESTMYRLLREHGEVRERRRQAVHPPRTKPELVAHAPNQVWSWDITKLAGPVKWTYFHLYTIIDIHSRYIVGWMVAAVESAALAEQFLAETITRHGIDRGQLVLHSDNGSSMASRPVAFLLADLGVTKSHSRPHCSNDNPYSESAFKTLKYRPDFPARFDSHEAARAHCRVFFDWYNNDHRHSGIGMYTPADVHHGNAGDVRAARAAVLNAAYATHPERFVTKAPTPAPLPGPAWINKPDIDSTNQLSA